MLSLVLRHKPWQIGLELDDHGWADTQVLIEKLNKAGVLLDSNLLLEVVTRNDKQRFIFNEDRSRIRANQGHSIRVDMAFEPVKPPATLFHGTAEKNVKLILSEGILKMNRQYVHLSTEKATALNVGGRHGKPIVFTVHSGDMHRDGIIFYRSENGVWLTDYVDPGYISL